MKRVKKQNFYVPNTKLKNYFKASKNRVQKWGKMVVLLPLKTTFTKVGVDGSLSSKPVKNFKNKP